MCVCAEEHQGDGGGTARLERGNKSHDLHMYVPWLEIFKVQIFH